MGLRDFSGSGQFFCHLKGLFPQSDTQPSTFPDGLLLQARIMYLNLSNSFHDSRFPITGWFLTILCSTCSDIKPTLSLAHNLQRCTSSVECDCCWVGERVLAGLVYRAAVLEQLQVHITHGVQLGAWQPWRQSTAFRNCFKVVSSGEDGHVLNVVVSIS